jgi:hypothetical protein
MGPVRQEAILKEPSIISGVGVICSVVCSATRVRIWWRAAMAAVAGLLPLVHFRSRLFGRFLVSVPFLNYGGVLASDAAAADALMAEARDVAHGFGASHVELRNTSRQFDGLPCRAHKLKLTRTLPSTPEALWSAVDRKVRNQVRKAQKGRPHCANRSFGVDC